MPLKCRDTTTPSCVHTTTNAEGHKQAEPKVGKEDEEEDEESMMKEIEEILLEV